MPARFRPRLTRPHRTIATLARLTVTIIALVLLTSCGPSSAQKSSVSPSPSDSGGVAPAGGDIPDNQVYLTYTASTFSIRYPEGWVQKARTDGVSFQDKDNRINVTITGGSAPTPSGVLADVAAIKGAAITSDARTVALPEGPAVVATYQVNGTPDPVTGKQPRLTVDHYEIAGSANRKAVIELGNRVGADNVDAYRLIVESFRWQ